MSSNRFFFGKKVTAKISANLNKVKGPFTILTKVDRRGRNVTPVTLSNFSKHLNFR